MRISRYLLPKDRKERTDITVQLTTLSFTSLVKPLPSYNIATLQHYHFTTLPPYNIATLQHCHLTTLPPYNIATLQHCHITTMPNKMHISGLAGIHIIAASVRVTQRAISPVHPQAIRNLMTVFVTTCSSRRSWRWWRKTGSLWQKGGYKSRLMADGWATRQLG
jgi:hypothetical protein